MGRENQVVGKIGEKAAIDFLKKKGYRIMHTNFRTIFGELDVIAKLKGSIVFIEIKTRATDSLGPPYLSVTALKQRRIIKNALIFLKIRHLLDCDWRIDVVSVKLDSGYRLKSIELIENAVENLSY
jgi:putative endonuclease